VRRRTLTAAAALAAIVIAACGGSSGGGSSSTASFKSQFVTSKTQFRRLGNDLGKSIEGARNKSDAQLAGEFDKLAARARTQAASLAKLNPPAKFKSKLRQLSSGLRSVSADLSAIAGAAKSHEALKAKAATTKLISDAAKVKAADNALTARLHLPKTR
jgi:hypothetical protein